MTKRVVKVDGKVVSSKKVTTAKKAAAKRKHAETLLSLDSIVESVNKINAKEADIEANKGKKKLVKGPKCAWAVVAKDTGEVEALATTRAFARECKTKWNTVKKIFYRFAPPDKKA